MTNQQINIEIAKACGWRTVDAYAGAVQWAGRWEQGNPSPVETSTSIPNYAESLDAMHQAENLLDNPDHRFTDDLKGSLSLYDKYAIFLSELFGRSIRATAAQRAECFLRVIGKWRDA